MVFPEMKGVVEGSLITAGVFSLALMNNCYGHLDMTRLHFLKALQHTFLQLIVQCISTIR